MPAPALSAKQLASVRDSRGRVNLWSGAIRSGKTIGSLIRWVMYLAAMANRSGEFVMIGRTRDSVWRNTIGPLQDPSLLGPTSTQIVGNYGAPTVTILGRRVHVLGASDAKAEAVLRGMTVLGAYVDEATTLPEAFFTQLLGRMSPPGAKLFATTNPDGPAHWLKRNFVDRNLPGWRIFSFKLDDNPSLTRSYVDAIRSEFTGLWYRRFILGEWVQAEGAIFDMWDETRHIVNPAEIPPLERVLALGVDHGTTNPTRGILLGMAQGSLWAVDEWTPAGGTDAELSANLQQWLTSRPPPEWIMVDPAAASFKLQLFRDGVTNAGNASNEVLPGIRTVASLLSADRLKVSRNCRKLIDMIPGYMWDPKATQRGDDAPVKLNDHEVDALRYATHSTRSLWANRVPLTTLQVSDD